jgi:hypothetical protein
LLRRALRAEDQRWKRDAFVLFVIFVGDLASFFVRLVRFVVHLQDSALIVVVVAAAAGA